MPIPVKAQPVLSSTKRVEKKDEDDEESLVRQVIAENPVEDVGVREEWKQQIGWHHKENVWVSPKNPLIMNRKQQPQQLRGNTGKESSIPQPELHHHMTTGVVTEPLSLSDGSHSSIDRVTPGGCFFILSFACIMSFWCHRGRRCRCRCRCNRKVRSV